jgi:hypothetical protein
VAAVQADGRAGPFGEASTSSCVRRPQPAAGRARAGRRPAVLRWRPTPAWCATSWNGPTAPASTAPRRSASPTSPLAPPRLAPGRPLPACPRLQCGRCAQPWGHSAHRAALSALAVAAAAAAGVPLL